MDFTAVEKKLDTPKVQVPLPFNPVHCTLDQDFGAIPESRDLVGMGPHVFTQIDNLVENRSTCKAQSIGEV